MCTIVAFYGVHITAPLVIASNRDEFYARPASRPAPLVEDPGIIAGRDLDHGGTWLGATRAGFFVGLTNQRSYRWADPGLRSRGEIALTLLRAGGIGAALEALRELDARDYNAFNLLFGGASGLYVAYGRRERTEIELHALPEGVHVLTNDRMFSPDFPKAERAARLARAALEAEIDSPEFRAIVADHEVPPLEGVPAPPQGAIFDHEIARQLQSVCIHTPTYGTRSSTLLALEHGRLGRYLFADGPPCTTPYEEISFERDS